MMLFAVFTQLFIIGSFGKIQKLNNANKEYFKRLICSYDFFCPEAEPQCTSVRHLVCPTKRSKPVVNSNYLRKDKSEKQRRGNKLKEDPSICSTPGCKSLADSIIKNMNSSVNPCVDFYEYACGRFGDEVDVSERKPIHWSALEEQTREVLNRLINITMSHDNSKLQKNETYIENIYAVYKSCLNTDELESRGITELAKTLEKLGSWPVMDGAQKRWNSNNFTLEKILRLLIKEGHNGNTLLKLRVNIMPTQTMKWDLELDQPETALPREMLVLEPGSSTSAVDYKDAYLEVMVNIAVLLKVPYQKAMTEMEEVLNFETALARISKPLFSKDDTTYNPVSVEELSKKFPYLNWLTFINSLLTEKIYNSDKINLKEPKFYEQLGPLLNKTSKRVIANYLLWRVIYDNIYFFGSSVEQKLAKLRNIASDGKSQKQPRAEFCTEEMIECFRPLWGRAFVRRFFTPSMKKQAKGLVKKFHKKFIEIINSTSWMDNQTRKKAIEKAKAFTFYIGYQDELIDNTTLKVYYDDLDVSQDKSFVENIAAARKHNAKIEWGRLHKYVNKEAWDLRPEITKVNAFYEPSTNGIAITAGMLQGLFYSEDRPVFYNMATLAYIVGHEMFHSIDNKGKKYDYLGVVKDWWTVNTEKRFSKIVDNLGKHYSNYKVLGANKKLKGGQVVSEAIADHGGLHTAYMLALDFLKENLNNKRNSQKTKKTPISMSDLTPLTPNTLLKGLPGLEKFNMAQLWWLSAAQPWCVSWKSYWTEYMIEGDPHLLANTRVNGPYRNSRQFALDWNCPKGAYMNPKHKINIL